MDQQHRLLRPALIGTNRIEGRVDRLQIAAASARSFFWRRTWGLTYAGGMSRTSWPSSAIVRAQKWAPAQASTPTRQGQPGENLATSARRNRRRITTPPAASTPCT